MGSRNGAQAEMLCLPGIEGGSVGVFTISAI
jgi:hypothetical protein